MGPLVADLLPLTGTLVLILGLVIALVGLLLWTRYQIAIQEAQQVDLLIETNTARPRPGMDTPDRRFHVVGGRGSDAG